MEMPDFAGLLRWVRILLPLAFVVLIGGFVASALNAYAVGYALFAVAAISAGSEFVLLRVLRSRVRSSVRETQVRQRADLDSTFRSDHR
jgi:hypothetical protein